MEEIIYYATVREKKTKINETSIKIDTASMNMTMELYCYVFEISLKNR